MRPRHLTAVLAVSVLAGCARPPAAEPAPGLSAPGRAAGAQPRITLADSIRYGDGMIEGYLRRVVVVHGGRQDTVPGVLVADAPVMGADGAVYGIRAREELAVGLFAYDVAARRVRALPTPEGWWESTVPRLAPDGRHVAYLAFGTDGTAHAAVAALPGGQVVYRGPRAVLLETGAQVDEITWLSPREFEIRVYLGGAAGGIQRVRGSVAPLAIRVDTLPDSWKLEQTPM
jgi:hypothetical protein